MDKSFYCHYTGKDGHTPRRRLQSLRFFSEVPAVSNSLSSPTPLWVEVLKGDKSDMLLFHAQLSDNVAVYTEFYLTTSMCNAMVHQEDLSSRFQYTVNLWTQFLISITDYTSWLRDHPDYITPPILNAYAEARPEEYQLLKSISNY